MKKRKGKKRAGRSKNINQSMAEQIVFYKKELDEAMKRNSSLLVALAELKSGGAAQLQQAISALEHSLNILEMAIAAYRKARE